MGINVALETISFQIGSDVVKKFNTLFQMPIDYLRQLDNELGSKNEVGFENSIMKKDKFRIYCTKLFEKELPSILKKEFNIITDDIVVIDSSSLGMGGTGMSIIKKGQQSQIDLFNYYNKISSHDYEKNKKDKRKQFEDYERSIDQDKVIIAAKNGKFELKMQLYISLGQLYLLDRIAVIKGKETNSFTLTAEEITAIFLHEIGHFFTLITESAKHIYKGTYGNHITQNITKEAKELYHTKDKKLIISKINELKEISLIYQNKFKENKNIDNELNKIQESSLDILKKIEEYKLEENSTINNIFPHLLLVFLFIYFYLRLIIVLFLNTILVLKSLFIGNIITSGIIKTVDKIGDLYNDHNSKFSEEIYSGKRGYSLFERHADEFAARYGVSSYLASALGKLHSYYTVNNLQLGFYNLEYFKRTDIIIFSMYFIVSKLARLMFLIHEDDLSTGYEAFRTRITRMAQDQIAAFKQYDLHPRIKADLLYEYEKTIKNIKTADINVKGNILINAFRDVTNFFIIKAPEAILDNVFYSMTGNEVIKMLDSFDELMSNKLYYYSAKLQSLK